LIRLPVGDCRTLDGPHVNEGVEGRLKLPAANGNGRYG
jgi:hypothetical protein